MNIVYQRVLCLVIMCFIFSVAHTQEKHDTLKMPVKPQLNTDKPFSRFDILSIPDPIGFGKLEADTIIRNGETIKKESLLKKMSVRQYMQYYEKDFIKWEMETYGLCQVPVNLSLGNPPPKTSISLFGLSLNLSVLHPGRDATRLSNGLPATYPIQNRQLIEMRKHMEQIERELQEKRRNYPFEFEGFESIIDEVFCFVRSDETKGGSKFRLSLPIKINFL